MKIIYVLQEKSLDQFGEDEGSWVNFAFTTDLQEVRKWRSGATMLKHRSSQQLKEFGEMVGEGK